MKSIIPEITAILEQTSDMSSFWETLRVRMMAFIERSDSRQFTCFFGPVAYRRHLMYDQHGNAHYPVDETIGLKPNLT